MLTSIIIKELLGVKIAQLLNVTKYSSTLIDDKYENSNSYSFSERIRMVIS